MTAQSKTTIYNALHKAQKQFTPLKQTGKAQYGKFFTLVDIMNSVKPALDGNDIIITFTTNIIVSGPMPFDQLTTRLYHVPSNTEIVSHIRLPDMNKGPQGTGGSITYMRRYTLQAMLNLKPDDATEDDGDFVSTGKTAPKSGW